MKALIIAATIAVVAALAPAAIAKDIWTQINESAPRSVFEDLQDSAPLAPAFETLRDNAP